jgi:hypothetical protein
MEFKLCPPYIEPVFFEQDDEQEMMQANITDIRSRSVSRTAEHGILDVPAQRRLMLENNEISRAEFVRQQLDDGFLEDGSPVAVLFYSEDTVIKKLLKFEGDPLMFEENDPQETIARIHVQMIECYKIMNEPSEARKRKAGEALAALEWLKGQYQHMIMEVEPDESDETEEEEPEPERSNGQVQEEVPVA